MWLTRLFVERPTLVTVFLALVILAGCVAGVTLVQQQFPSTETPSIQVLVTYPGASTTEMRDAIVRPLEDQIAGAPELDHLESSIEPGQASIVAVSALDSKRRAVAPDLALQSERSRRHVARRSFAVAIHG